MTRNDITSEGSPARTGSLIARRQRRAGDYLLRTAALVLGWTILLGLLTAAGEAVVQSSSISAFDRHITSTLMEHRSPGITTLMKAVTWLGSWVAVVVGSTLLVILTLRRRVPVLGLILAAEAWAGEQLGVTLAKNIVRRPRPPHDVWLVTAHGWSWPSGHASASTLVFGALALTVSYLTADRRVRAVSWVLAMVAVVAVAFSRVYLGVHWITDVIAGILFVSIWLTAVVAAWGQIDQEEDLRTAAGSAPQDR